MKRPEHAQLWNTIVMALDTTITLGSRIMRDPAQQELTKELTKVEDHLVEAINLLGKIRSRA